MSYSTNDPNRKKAAPNWVLWLIIGGAVVIIGGAIIWGAANPIRWF